MQRRFREISHFWTDTTQLIILQGVTKSEAFIIDTVFVIPGLFELGGQPAFAQNDIEALQEEITQQKKQLNEQMRNIEALERKLNDVESQEAPAAGEPEGKSNTQKGTQPAKTAGSAKGAMKSAPEIFALQDTTGAWPFAVEWYCAQD